MCITPASAIVSLVMLGAPAFVQSFVGKWTATSNAPSGSASEILTVVKVDNGFAITGKAVVPPPEGVAVSPGRDIVLDGNRFSYKRTLTVPGGTIVIIYSGIVSGDKFTGTVEMGEAKIPYAGVHIKGSG